MRSVVSKYGLIVLLLSAAIGSLALWFDHRSHVGPDDIRNVLLISIDTCRADHLSCYGYESKTTPNIDAVAAEGILFENVIAPVAQTLPSHSSMLTGTIPPYHGVHENIGNYLADESNITLPEILKDAGFVTAAAISGFPLDSGFGISQGFDEYYDRFETLPEKGRLKERKGAKTTDVALEWLEKNKDKRFFYFLHYFDPHVEYKPPEPFASRFAANPYAGEIAYTDHCIGQVLDKLKELGLYDSTLIIITSDHGEMLGEHGELTHAYFIYQSNIRVPLIFKLPGQNKPVRIKSIAGLVDIVPTVCCLLDIELPNNVHGVDLFAHSKGKDASDQDRYVYCESLLPTHYNANPLLGVVNDRYKYIQTTHPELYDLVADPGESSNLVKTQRKRAMIMQDELARILEQSVRKGSPDSKLEMDTDTLSQLKSLGYVGGAVSEDFSIDHEKDDPKDLIAYHEMSGQSGRCLSLRDYANAEMYAGQLIKQRPDLFHGYELRAKILLEQKDYSQALVYFDRAINLNAKNSELYRKRSEAYFAVGNYNQTIHDLDKAIELTPADAQAYNNRGIAYASKGDYNRAIHDLDKAIELSPADAQAYRVRGFAHAAKGGYNLAIHDYDKAIELNPTDGLSHKAIGKILAELGNAKEAVKHYRRALELRSNWPEVLNDLAKILATHKDPELRNGTHAVRLAERACHLTGYRVPVLLDTLATAYAEVGEFDKAIKTAEMAVALAQKVQKTELAEAIRARMELYKTRQPYRQAYRVTK